MRLTIPRRVTRALMGIYRYSLTLVCAPPGFGKTAVMNNFLSRRKSTAHELPVTLLDDADRLAEPPPEFAKLFLCVEGKGVRQTCLPRDRKALHPRGADSAPYIVLLCRRIPPWLPEEILCADTTLLLGADTLTLTAEEIGEERYIATGGWPVMVSLPERERVPWAREHVLEELNPVLRDILAVVSLEDTFSPGMAAYLTGNDKAPFLLERFAAECALLARDEDSTGLCWRMNPVLRAAAREELGQDPARMREVCRRYSLWAERRGDALRALEYYELAGNFHDALALLDQADGGGIAERSPELVVRLTGRFEPHEGVRYPYAMLAGVYAKLLHTAPEEGRLELSYIRATLGEDERLADRAQICGEIAWIEAFAAKDATFREAYIREAKEWLGGRPSRLFPVEMLARLEQRLPFTDAARSAAEMLESCVAPEAQRLASVCRAAIEPPAPEEAYVRRAYAKGRTLPDIAGELGLDKERAGALVASVYRRAGVNRKRELVEAERRSVG